MLEAQTREYGKAREALAALSAFASNAPRDASNPPGEVSRSAAALVPILALPDCVVEEMLTDGSVINEHALNGTRTVRALARAAEADVDAALIDVARGRYEGVTFSLGDREELRDRHATLARAHKFRQVSLTA